MKKPNITEGEWKWQKFGDEHYLTAQHGMRPMVLATLDGKIAVRKDGLLEKLNPEHPDAKAISAVPEMIDALINARKELITAHKIIGSSCIEDVQFEVEEALEKAGVEL